MNNNEDVDQKDVDQDVIKDDNHDHDHDHDDLNDIKNELRIIKQDTGLNRNTIDKYYTKPIIAAECVELVKVYVVIDKTDLIIEPSAGNGSFIESIKTLSNNYRFYDLEPEHEEIIKQDFLEFQIDNINKLKQGIDYKNIHIIGNPPFGRQASTAIKFIKHCCKFANSISFILPKSFKKESMMRKFSNRFRLIYSKDLPENAFLINQIECHVPCVFQIWILQNNNDNRIIYIKHLPAGFIFVNKDGTPDISIRRVGINAGMISTETETKSPQTHYFIKFTNGELVTENVKKLNGITFEFNNTVGPRSISKPEVILEFNRLLV